MGIKPVLGTIATRRLRFLRTLRWKLNRRPDRPDRRFRGGFDALPSQPSAADSGDLAHRRQGHCDTPVGVGGQFVRGLAHSSGALSYADSPHVKRLHCPQRPKCAARHRLKCSRPYHPSVRRTAATASRCCSCSPASAAPGAPRRPAREPCSQAATPGGRAGNSLPGAGARPRRAGHSNARGTHSAVRRPGRGCRGPAPGSGYIGPGQRVSDPDRRSARDRLHLLPLRGERWRVRLDREPAVEPFAGALQARAGRVAADPQRRAAGRSRGCRCQARRRSTLPAAVPIDGFAAPERAAEAQAFPSCGRDVSRTARPPAANSARMLGTSVAKPTPRISRPSLTPGPASRPGVPAPPDCAAPAAASAVPRATRGTRPATPASRISGSRRGRASSESPTQIESKPSAPRPAPPARAWAARRPGPA